MRSWRAPAAGRGGGKLESCGNEREGIYLPWLIVVWLLLMKVRAGSELKR